MALNAQIRFDRQHWSLDIDLELPSRGVSALYGPSGCGKTTVLHILAGLQRGRRGSQISLDSQPWQSGSQFVAPEHRGVGYVFQDGRLFPHLTVTGNLDYAVKRRFSENGPSVDEVCQWLQIGDLLTRRPQQLSGGEQQRVAIARTLVSAPQLLLLDEPLSALDSENREKAMSLLEALHRRLSIPVIYVSHQLEEVMRLADYVVLMQQGRLIAQGDIATLSTSLDSPLIHHSGVGSVLEATTIKYDHEYGITEVAIDDTATLLLAQPTAQQAGARIRLRVPAEAVSLSKTVATDSSVLNILPATVQGWQQQGESHVLVRLQLGQQPILARITRKSLQRMDLSHGDVVYAQIKGVALLSDHGTD